MNDTANGPPDRFDLGTGRPGHDVHWTLAAELVKVIWRRHNATFAATVKEFYGAPPRAADGHASGDRQEDGQP